MARRMLSEGAYDDQPYATLAAEAVRLALDDARGRGSTFDKRYCWPSQPEPEGWPRRWLLAGQGWQWLSLMSPAGLPSACLREMVRQILDE